MRALIPTVLVLATILMAPALAGSTVFVTDPVGDQRLAVAGSLTWPAQQALGLRCRDAATDVTGFEYGSNADLLTVRISVADLGSRVVTCGGLSLPRSNAQFSAGFSPTFANCAPDDLTCAPYGETVDMRAVLKADGFQGCAFVSFPEGVTSGCLGNFAVHGNTLEWTLPMSGSFESDAGDVRSYDLVGDAMDIGAGATSAVDTGTFDPTTLIDSVAVQSPQTL